mgnify:CR=1 FL=1
MTKKFYHSKYMGFLLPRERESEVIPSSHLVILGEGLALLLIDGVARANHRIRIPSRDMAKMMGQHLVSGTDVGQIRI